MRRVLQFKDIDDKDLAEIIAECEGQVDVNLKEEISSLLAEVKTLHGDAYAAFDKSYNTKVSEKKECNDEFEEFLKVRANFKSKIATIKTKLDKSKSP